MTRASLPALAGWDREESHAAGVIHSLGCRSGRCCYQRIRLTSDEIKAKLEAAGYSQIREMPSGKIKTFKCVKDGRERSILVDSNGHINEFQ